MKNKIIITFVVFIFPFFSYAGEIKSTSAWQTVESFDFNWNLDGNLDHILLEKPQTYYDAGAYTRLRIQIPGQKDFILDGFQGEEFAKIKGSLII